MDVIPRYKCKCCKYKDGIHSFAYTCVSFDLEDQQVQNLCSYLMIPVEKPKEWSALDSKQTYPRPSVWRALDHQGIIEMWCQRPYKLVEILREVLYRDDLAGKLQELLDKYPTVMDCLYHLRSNDSSPASNVKALPIQETTAAVKVAQQETNPSTTLGVEEEQTEDGTKCTSQGRVSGFLSVPVFSTGPSHEEHQNLPQPTVENEDSQSVKVVQRSASRDSDWFRRRASSGFSERTALSIDYLQRADSGTSIRKRTNETLANGKGYSLALSEIEESSDKPPIDGFCSDCRSWINNISPNGSLQASPTPSLSPPDNASSTENSQSLTSSASSKFESSVPTISNVEKKISGRIVIKKKELVKKLGSSKHNSFNKSFSFPKIKQLHGHPVQYKMRLHAQSSESAAAASEPQSCTTISLDAIPAIPVSQDTSHVLPSTVYLSVYATNDKTATDTNHTTVMIMNNTKQEVEEATIKETTEIAQFPGVITPELLKMLEEKYIVTEMRVVYSITDPIVCDRRKEAKQTQTIVEQLHVVKPKSTLTGSQVFGVYLHGYHQRHRVVSQYYRCAENSAHIPFIDPVTVIVCDHQGIEHTLADHDITVTIPPGVIPKGKVVHFEMGVALYGPFSFHGNTCPISPILWLCPQEEIEFNLPIMVTLPHFLTGVLSQQELAQLGVSFAKADHNDFSRSKESQNVMFKFQPCLVQPLFTYKEKQGFATLETMHCCYLCLQANQSPLLARRAGFCLSRIDYLSVSSTYVVKFYVTFFLKTCIKVLKLQFPTSNLLNVRQYRFTFRRRDDGSEPSIKITIENTVQDKYHSEIVPLDGMIKLSAVDFWRRDCKEDELMLEHQTGMYPPRVEVNFRPLGNHQELCTVQVTVTGSDSNLNNEINLPLVSHSPSSTSLLSDHSQERIMRNSNSKLDSEVNLPLVSSSLHPLLNSASEEVTFNRETKKLTITEHLKIYQYLQNLEERDIVLLGQALGLLRPKLKRMRTLPEDMIEAWLNLQDHVMITSGRPTWKSLCEALKRIKQHGTAQEIQEKELSALATRNASEL